MQIASNISELQRALHGAQGTAEFAIVVVSDVRDFSEFSKIHESPETALYIKRVYLELIGKYFSTAKFVKPTGDGLLCIFPYTESDLGEVAETVITNCFRCLEEFGSICKDDPMINFDTPCYIGFGISRGPTCCLHSDGGIIDYSGYLLNLASRLMGVARPSGIVIDASFLRAVIPASHRDDFDEQEIFLRTVAENAPRRVLYSKKHVQIPESCLLPIRNLIWDAVNEQITLEQIDKLTGTYRIDLPAESVSKATIKIIARFQDFPCPGVDEEMRLSDFHYDVDADGAWIIFPLREIVEYAKQRNIPSTHQLELRVHFVPKRLARTQNPSQQTKCTRRTKKLSL